ncbi:MAG: TonB family protein [Ghiorsea sp.]
MLAWYITVTKPESPITERKSPPIMDVVLLDESQTSQDESPSDAKTISNKNSTGQMQNAQDNQTRAARSPSSQKKKRPKKKPTPNTPEQPRIPPVPTQKSKKNTRLLTRFDDESPALLPPKQDPSKEKKTSQPPVPNIPFANLLPAYDALTQLDKEFERERRMKQLLSKEADIGINTREAKYAPYAQGLVRSLEEQWRPSGKSIEQLAPEQRKVLMSVSIEHNGELGDIKILQPSPSRELNESAVAAVHAASPFKPLPSSWGLDRANFYFVFEMVEDRFVFRTL